MHLLFFFVSDTVTILEMLRKVIAAALHNYEKKNVVCVLQINCKPLTFPLEKSCRNEQTINSFSQLKAVSTVSNMLNKTF